MKDPFLTPDAMKDPFVALSVMKDPFIAQPPTKPGAKPTTRLPAIPSTWRSPITPCQGGCKKHAVVKALPP